MSGPMTILAALLWAGGVTAIVFAVSLTVRRWNDGSSDDTSRVPDTGAVPGGRGGPDPNPDE